tara:strand:- start:2078 stop:2335 length:258 start_codon:yes stop_codon:yes gene_type:complete
MVQYKHNQIEKKREVAHMTVPAINISNMTFETFPAEGQTRPSAVIASTDQKNGLVASFVNAQTAKPLTPKQSAVPSAILALGRSR